MNFGTWLHTLLRGRLVGTDAFGNRYYTERRPRRGAPARRWMTFKGVVEATALPPEWHAWMHYTTDEPIPVTDRRPWQKPYQPNLSGTPGSYRPPGHEYRGGHRARATGDYEAWTPGG